MTTYSVGTELSNGFTVLQTPTSVGNNTGEYLIANSVAMQYYVTLSEIQAYNVVGNNNNGSGGSSGSSGSGYSGGTGSTTVFSTSALPGSPFVQIPASEAVGDVVIATTSGSMVRLVNLSGHDQTAVICGYDNASTASGPLLFAQQMQAGQTIEIAERTQYGITVAIVGSPLNSDFGINVVNDTGANAVFTGFPFTQIPASSTGPIIIASTSGYCVGLLNNSLLQQNAQITGYDNASTTSGRVLFNETLEPGQAVYLGEQTFFGITVAITNGPTNVDYGVNVIHA